MGGPYRQGGGAEWRPFRRRFGKNNPLLDRRNTILVRWVNRLQFGAVRFVWYTALRHCTPWVPIGMVTQREMRL